MVDIYLDCSNCNTREWIRNVLVKLQYEMNKKGKKQTHSYGATPKTRS